MRPGLYRIETRHFVAGFVIDEKRQLGACAPILRGNVLFWFKVAVWISP